MSEPMIGIIGILILLLLFVSGIELGFSMALVGFVGFSYIVSIESAYNILAKDVFSVFSGYTFTVIPLFILMGQIAFNAGIARRLYDAAYKFIGHVPGGLAMATVVGATAFKAICGSSPATAATFASVAVPEMDRHNYSKKLSTGVVATVGTLGVILPPSVTLIIFGFITEQSIASLFLAGIIPGLIIALFFMFTIYGWCRISPSLGPKGEKSTWKERIHAFPEFGFVTMIFFLVIGGMMAGFFTPTEAGSIGTGAVLLLALVKKDINFAGLMRSAKESTCIACMILMLLAGSAIFGHFLAITRLPVIASAWVVSLPFSRYIILIMICLIYLLGGSFIDDLAFMILATPIFFPAAIKLGFDPLWFGIMICVTVMVGVIIPPVAMNVFVVKNITKVPMGVIYAGCYPFLVGIIISAILFALFPQLVTFLPSVLLK